MEGIGVEFTLDGIVKSDIALEEYKGNRKVTSLCVCTLVTFKTLIIYISTTILRFDFLKIFERDLIRRCVERDFDSNSVEAADVSDLGLVYDGEKSEKV